MAAVYARILRRVGAECKTPKGWGSAGASIIFPERNATRRPRPSGGAASTGVGLRSVVPDRVGMTGRSSSIGRGPPLSTMEDR